MIVRSIYDLSLIELSCLGGLVLFDPENSELDYEHGHFIITGVYKEPPSRLIYSIETAVFKGAIVVNKNLTVHLLNHKGEVQLVPNILQALDYLTGLLYD